MSKENERSQFMKELIQEALKEFNKRPKEHDFEDLENIPPAKKAKPSPRQGGARPRQEHMVSDEVFDLDNYEIEEDENNSFAQDEVQIDDWLKDDDETNENSKDEEGLVILDPEEDWIDELGEELDDGEETGPAVADNLL